MYYTNFEKLNELGGLLNNFNALHAKNLISEREYIYLTRIESKYYDLLTDALNAKEFNKIKNELAIDFGHHKVLETYLAAIMKEKYLLYIYKQIKRDIFIKTFKIQILIQLFITTIKYGDKILNRPNNVKINHQSPISNFRLYVMMINPMIIYRYFGLLQFSQAQVLKRLLDVKIDWDVDKTFNYLLIHKNNLFDLKVFNMEKEIIRETTEDCDKEAKEFSLLTYHTYIKLLTNFIAKNTLENIQKE